MSDFGQMHPHHGLANTNFLYTLSSLSRSRQTPGRTIAEERESGSFRVISGLIDAPPENLEQVSDAVSRFGFGT